MSDHPGFFAHFAAKFDVSNSYHHKFPFCDLFSVPDEAIGQFEFVVCSDVLEHVAGSPLAAVEGLWKLLKPGGFAVITVPVGGSRETLEYYPGLSEFEIHEGPLVRWKDHEGIERVDPNPEMHGGDGLVLAFRRYGKNDFEGVLRCARFINIEEGPLNPLLGVWPLPDARQGGVFVAWKPD